VSRLKIVYWHDIPGQVVARSGRRNVRYRLSSRFSNAIERAANRCKKRGEDALFDPWHSVDQLFAGDVIEQAQKLVDQLEYQYNDQVLDRLIHSSGKNFKNSLND
jgi:hypothetical protein